MLDRDYFETDLPAQIEAAGRPLAVTLVLRTGHSFRLRSLGRVGEEHAVFGVYPSAVAGAIRGGRPSGGKRLTAGPGPEWLVVAFETISHVTLSAEPNQTFESNDD